MERYDIITKHFDEHLSVINKLPSLYTKIIDIAIVEIAKSLAKGGTLFWCGNGGSAADSQHLAAEFVGRFKKDRKPLRSIALTTDTSILTCVANDYSFEDIFSRQLQALGGGGDILVAITTSGNSENILRVLKTAKTLGVKTLALIGNEGGKAKTLADFSITIPSNSTARIQEAHILIGHILCDLIEQELGYA